MCRDDEIDLSVGLRDGQLLFINEVERGLDCGCSCPHCGGRLIAKKGDIKQHHFAHYNAENCGKGLETALHLLGKQVLMTEKQVRLPDTDELRQLCYLAVERRRFGYIADVGAVLEATGEEVDIEIKVTHGVDDEKKERVLKNQALMLEIDLSGVLLGGSVTRESVVQAVLYEAPREWVEASDVTVIDDEQQDTKMNDKYLVVGFKAVSGYSRKNQSNFDFQTLHVLVELENRPSQNYQIHAIGGYEQKNIPVKLTERLLATLESQTLPAWAELTFETQLVNGTPKALVTDVRF
ncbi:competence protein CoiA family protein [Marinobacterium nitratireducens]|nr:competence protein CoiA family protein [Marinobacterium nitratireducens]